MGTLTFFFFFFDSVKVHFSTNQPDFTSQKIFRETWVQNQDLLAEVQVC